MCSERFIQLFCVLAFVGLLAWSPGAATANVIWSEDFSGSPSLNGGNWSDQITYGGFSDSIRAGTPLAAMPARTPLPGSAGYTASNTNTY